MHLQEFCFHSRDNYRGNPSLSLTGLIVIRITLLPVEIENPGCKEITVFIGLSVTQVYWYHRKKKALQYDTSWFPREGSIHFEKGRETQAQPSWGTGASGVFRRITQKKEETNDWWVDQVRRGKRRIVCHGDLQKGLSSIWLSFDQPPSQDETTRK